MSVAAIIPARNEADRISSTVEALRGIAEIAECIVVDDGSSDATGVRAAAAGARLIRSDRRRGKGGALAAGVARTDADVLLFIDADLEQAAARAVVLLEPVLDGRLDMAIAAPPPGAPSGFGLVEGLARVSIRAMTGRRMARPLSGQRALHRRVLEAAHWPIAGFGVETGLTIDALRAGLRVDEVPMPVEHRLTGRTPAGFAHRARQGFDVLRVSLSRGVRFGSR